MHILCITDIIDFRHYINGRRLALIQRALISGSRVDALQLSFYMETSERQGSDMSDYQMLSIVIAILNLIVMILLKYIDHIKK